MMFPNWSRAETITVPPTPEICGLGKPDTVGCGRDPATSCNVPKLVVLLGKMDVPVFVILPDANGVAAVGRTRMFEYVSVFLVWPLLLLVTVREIVFVVMLSGMMLPLVRPFMFLLLLSPLRVMMGCGALVSN